MRAERQPGQWLRLRGVSQQQELGEEPLRAGGSWEPQGTSAWLWLAHLISSAQPLSASSNPTGEGLLGPILNQVTIAQCSTLSDTMRTEMT